MTRTHRAETHRAQARERVESGAQGDKPCGAASYRSKFRAPPNPGTVAAAGAAAGGWLRPHLFFEKKLGRTSCLSGMLVAMVHAAVSIYGQRAVAEIHCQRTVAATNTFVSGNEVAS